jgi:hypothetical protein
MRISIFVIAITVFEFVFSQNCDAQTFTFQFISDSISFGQPNGNDIVVEGNIINNSAIDLEVDVIRKQNALPSGWESYLCTDICLPSFMDSTRLYLPANTAQNFKLSFITSNVIDTGMCLIEFKNISNNNNIFRKNMYGVTDPSASIQETNIRTDFDIYPNPAIDQINFNSSEEVTNLSCFDLTGKRYELIAAKSNSKYVINISRLNLGLYFLNTLKKDGGMKHLRFLKQ